MNTFFRLLIPILLLGWGISTPVYADKLKLSAVHYKANQQQLHIVGHQSNQSAQATVHDEAQNILFDGAVNKNFNLKLSVTDTVPCTIWVTIGDRQQRAEVNNAPDDCGLLTTTLSGRVTDQPIPYATVTVTVAGQTFTTVADADGYYQLDIVSADADELVLVEADGNSPATGDPITFVNLIGSFERVISEPEANVTNVTTAKYSLLVEANGGTAPTDLTTLEQAETSIDASELLKLAAVIKLIVDDPRFSLPAGYTSLLEFVGDENAVASFEQEVASVDPEALEQTILAIVGDSDLVAGFTVAEIPAQYYQIPTANPGYMARSGSVLEFNPGGDGNFLSIISFNGQPVNDRYLWTVTDGRLELTYQNPEIGYLLISDITDVTDDPALIQQYRDAGGSDLELTAQQRRISTSFTRIEDGTLVDSVLREDRSERTVSVIELRDGSSMTVPPYYVISQSYATLRASTDVEAIAASSDCSTPVCINGSWGGVFYYSPGLQQTFNGGLNYETSSYGEIISFSGTTASGLLSSNSASWQITDGRLQINYPGGMQQTVTFIDNQGLEYGALSVFDDGSKRFASYDVWVKADPAFDLAGYLLTSTPDSYWNGDINAWIPGAFDANGDYIYSQRFGWQFAADGSADNWYYRDWTDNDGDGVNDVGRIITPTQGYTNTTDYTAIQRFTFAQRRWYPIANTVVNGQRVFYIIEVEYRDESLWFGGVPGYRVFIPPRINIERELPEFSDWDYTETALGM